MLRSLLPQTRAVAGIESPEVPLTSTTLADWLELPSITETGVVVTDSTALTKFVALYRAIYLVAGSIAGLPLVTYKGDATPGGDREYVPAPSVLRDPCPAMEPVVFWETCLAHLLGGGNLFLTVLTRDSFNRPAELDFVSGRVKPRKVPKFTDPNRRVYDVDDPESGQRRTFASADVLHLMGPTIDGMLGLSPIGVARNAVGVALAQEMYQGRLFKKGALNSGLLQTDANLSDPKKRELRKKWDDTSAGLENAGGVGIISGGMKYIPLSMSPSDAQFVASRYFQVEEIARLYGIPPDFLGVTQGEASNFGTGIEQRGLHMVTYCLMTWITRLEQFISRRLLPRGTNAQLVPDGLYRGDIRARTEASVRRVLTGLATVNEERRREGIPPIAGGDVRYMPVNMQPLGPDGMPIAAEPADDNGEPGDVNDVDVQPDRGQVTPSMVEALLSLGGQDGS